MSIFLETNHMVLRAPDGGPHNVQAMKDAGFGAIFLNIGDYTPSAWDLIRHRAKDANVPCGPWLRTASPTGMFDVAKLDHLISVADDWGSPLVVNSESELKGSGPQLTKLLVEKLGNRDWALSMEAWPFFNVEWWPLKNIPVLPQIFPAESEAAKRPDDCRNQWHIFGINCVVFTFGSYWDQMPDDFDRLTPYGVYTADDCGGDYASWSPKGKHNPCVVSPSIPPEVAMADIGSQHGITSFVDWLQKQPGVPTKHGADYDKNNPATWPWPERLERTLNMLREDHDKRN